MLEDHEVSNYKVSKYLLHANVNILLFTIASSNIFSQCSVGIKVLNFHRIHEVYEVHRYQKVRSLMKN